MSRVLDDYANIYRGDGALNEVAKVYRAKDGVWFEVWSEATALAATLSTNEVYGARTSSGSITVTTETALLNITGGEAPYTILWERVGTGSPAWTINNDNAPGPSFSVNVAPGAIQQATFNATVTDALGAMVTSADLTATAENHGGFL